MSFLSDIFDWLFTRVRAWWLCAYAFLAMTVNFVTTVCDWIMLKIIQMLNAFGEVFADVNIDHTGGVVADCWASDFAQFLNYVYPLAETVTALVFLVSLWMACVAIRIIKACIPTESG